MSLIAITGGIGSGKSVVSNVLRAIGYEVYDCDIMARRLMQQSTSIKERIATEIAAEALTSDGDINRTQLARIVFSDPEMLRRLNAIVHHHVREHLHSWYSALSTAGTGVAFVETAILYESHIDRMVDSVWQVEADTETRVSRVMARNNISREEVLNRIASQQSCVPDSERHPSTHIIVNSGTDAILPRIEALLRGESDDTQAMP